MKVSNQEKTPQKNVRGNLLSGTKNKENFNQHAMDNSKGCTPLHAKTYALHSIA